MSTDIIQLNYKLVGPNAGKTIKLSKNKFHFVNGIYTLEVREDHVDKFKGLTRLLARAYNAHPEGSKALERAEAEWAANPASGSATIKKVKNAPVQKATDDSQANAETEDGAEGNDNGSGDGEESELSELEVALNKLDVLDDSHWTTTGLPNLGVLEKMLQRKTNRAEIAQVAPGFNRQVAADAETE